MFWWLFFVIDWLLLWTGSAILFLSFLRRGDSFGKALRKALHNRRGLARYTNQVAANLGGFARYYSQWRK
jgi:hypothetical protein